MFVKRISVLSLSLVLSALPVSASAASFSELVVFGDSLSDTGNAAIFTEPNFQQIPFGGLVPSLPYESGRLTNGLTWVENLAASLGLDASPSFDGGTIFAFGGARTGPAGSILPSLLDQFSMFHSQTEGVASSEALYVVWGGSNNLISEAAIQKQEGDDAAASATVSQAVKDITTIVEGLTTAGAVNVVVPNATDLGRNPLATRGEMGLDVASTAVSVEFNALLSGELSQFRSNSAIDLIEVDVFEFANSIFASPASFGLTNVDDPCVDLTSVCTNPDEFFFYDGIHPTSVIHAEFAQLIEKEITPEPSSLLGIALSLGLGVLSTKRKKTPSL